MLETFYQSSFFPSVTLKAFASINCSKMYLNNKMTHVISASTGISGVSLAHYISQTGTATYLVYCIFLKQTSGREHLNELNLKKFV